jgi:hypothetical protein
MPLMRCPFGRGLYTRDGVTYVDNGAGEVEVADIHVLEALGAGWTLVTVAEPSAAEEPRTEAPPEPQEAPRPEPGHDAEADRPAPRSEPEPHRETLHLGHQQPRSGSAPASGRQR